ncbi:spore maturation protein [Paenibacillus sacheonensis]|uniref:Spore maturation protein n=2 Tax=Paenibacillus sacheonensis TaxID=742054 RepID=A0A7X4YMA9_9BACL|nr:spore maturation protein [Paenibacillus sacheonensis]MBM7564443.1 spore maturation protein B [Paenibacillus sacheonensis]NBC69005.1 spore maturation protein [Paenibacillus sacheonensis]
MYEWVTMISAWLIPFMIVFIPLYAAFKRVPVYETFIDGAKDGFGTAINIIPHLVGMMVAISMFRASGAMDMLASLIRPLFDSFGIPSEVLPLGLLRPLTGAGSLAFTTELIKTYGPDSMIGRISSTVQGSTDTTLYVLTVYFGAVGIRKSKYALKVGLFSDLVGFFAAIIICLFVFGT